MWRRVGLLLLVLFLGGSVPGLVTTTARIWSVGGGLKTWYEVLAAVGVLLFVAGLVRFRLLAPSPLSLLGVGLLAGVAVFGALEAGLIAHRLARGGELHVEGAGSESVAATQLVLWGALTLGLPVGLGAGLLVLVIRAASSRRSRAPSRT